MFWKLIIENEMASLTRYWNLNIFFLNIIYVYQNFSWNFEYNYENECTF